MIEVATIETAKSTGEALTEQFRFRHRHFIINERWELPSHNGMEYDQFDTPAAVYLVWRDKEGVVRGMIRLLPTTVPYMLNTIWPGMLPSEESFCSPAIWEITRFGIERGLPRDLRKRISSELILSCVELAIDLNIDTFLFLTSWVLLKKIVPAAGMHANIYKRSTLPSGHDVASAAIPIYQELLYSVRAKLGIYRKVIASRTGGMHDV